MPHFGSGLSGFIVGLFFFFIHLLFLAIRIRVNFHITFLSPYNLAFLSVLPWLPHPPYHTRAIAPPLQQTSDSFISNSKEIFLRV